MLCFLAITIQFKQPAYIVSENDGPAQFVLILSNPSSTDITVQVEDIMGTAIGKSTLYK